MVPTRINSTLVNNDILGTLTNNADHKLDKMFKQINENGKGAIIFINQSIQPTNLLKRLDIIRSTQKKGTVVKAPNIKMDAKDFGIGAVVKKTVEVAVEIAFSRS